ncbi:MAG TPA: c-type cytochrome biogenesis protein CcmI [Burkholderiales bacterium]|jgi:cytochrome c-type biogenesis protein CcmH|nr:c-type cytochrome biogenesis protein CcmI [Burkholderiales bacterium]
MILFWVLGVALAALVLALVLRPLLVARPGAAAQVSRKAANLAVYRDQLRELEAELAAGKIAPADHQRAKDELQARMLEDVDAATLHEAAPRRAGRGAALAVGVAVPVCAFAVYLFVGSPDAVVPREGPGAMSEVQIEAMVERLAAKMRENPDDPEGWKMLGRSYAVLGRFADAVGAYAKAAERAPRDAELLADFADALAMVHGQKLQGEPEKLVLRALEIDPQNLKALALAGTAAFHRNDFKRAADYWQRMLPLVPPDSEEGRAIRDNIAEANARAGAPVARSEAPTVKPSAVAHPGIRGTVRLAQKLRGQLSPGDTLFVYARAAEGPQVPLAVLRRKAGELPLAFALDDAMAMAPGMNVSAFSRVVITARVSRSGNAKPEPGDLQGASKPVANDAKGVIVEINEVVR